MMPRRNRCGAFFGAAPDSRCLIGGLAQGCLSYACDLARIALDFDEPKLDALCWRYGVARLEVFGSVARGTAGPDSDLDLLYELAPGSTLGWEIDDLQEELTVLFGRRVDLVSKRKLHRRLRTHVLAEVLEFYAA